MVLVCATDNRFGSNRFSVARYRIISRYFFLAIDCRYILLEYFEGFYGSLN